MICLFFSLFRDLQSSTLFPYTTLFRSEPRRGDLLAVPATGAYTLGMGSNYNAVPRPAAVLVAGGETRLIRRRERSEEHTSELQSLRHLVCRLLLEKKKIQHTLTAEIE